MKNNQRGFSVVEVLISAVIMGLIVGIGYYAWQRLQNQKPTATNITQSQEESSKNEQQITQQSTQQETTQKSATDYYQISLPEGWKITNQKPNGVAFDDAFIYADESGKKLTVYVNIGNVGGAGDALIEYEVVNEKIVLNTQSVTLPNCPSDGNPCENGDNKLRVMASSASDIKSNNYLFDYEDTKTESLQSLAIFKTIVESMRF